MKKFLAIILALTMVLSLAACGDTNSSNGENGGTVTDAPEETGLPVVAPADSAKDTLGYLYYEKLLEIKNANPAATAEEIANAIMESKLGTACPGCMVAPVEPGFLQGLSSEEANFGGSFVSGQVIIPMMMGQPFIVYFFDLAEDADVKAFVNALNESANPGWNICTIAETVTTGAVGNTAFIAMCQKAIPSSVSGIASVITPEAAEVAEAFEIFKTVMPEHDGVQVNTEAVANAMVNAGVSGEVSIPEGFIVNDYFLYEVDSWGSAKITDGDKEIYIFGLGMGADVNNWASYNCEAKEGATIIWGAYNETVIVFLGYAK